MKKILFIDRDGTLILEPVPTYQVDSFEKLVFYPEVFYWLKKIAKELDYELVMVTNQDGLGNFGFPEEKFWPIQNFIIKCFANEQIIFSKIHIDNSFEADNKNTRKPNTGMLTEYIDNPLYDISNSYVIGDRLTDIQLASNLGSKAILLNDGKPPKEYQQYIDLHTNSWEEIYALLKIGKRIISYERNTNETNISIKIDLDGSGNASINTGLPFFNHMLEQLCRHSNIDLSIVSKGDLHIDEHHTIEDTGIALGEVFAKALGNKKGIERYGFCLPMDDCLAQVAIDFGGRSWLVWDADFKREKIGDMPTEMFYHFFKSFTDGAKCNLNIKAEGQNEHHKIEVIFKALAKSIKMSIKRDVNNMELPSTKGIL